MFYVLFFHSFIKKINYLIWSITHIHLSTQMMKPMLTPAEQICDPVLLPPLSLPPVFGVMFQEQPPCTHKTLTTRFNFILFFMHKLMQIPELKRS